MKKAILKTLIYADIFDYPLTEAEIRKYLISPKRINQLHIQEDRLIKKKEKYFYLESRQQIVGIRKERKLFSKKKLKIARKVASWLKVIPWIRMVAVSGALAMENSPKDDDIDFLIISAEKRLWLTRLLAVLLTELFGQRRRPNSLNFKDKICLNMFLDEAHLGLPKSERNLFSSHEICQLKLLWDKGQTYQKFIGQNQWVKKYLANWRF